MHARLVLAVLALLSVSFPALAAAPPADTFRPNDPCYTLGATHMSADNSGLVICGLVTGNGATSCASNADGCKWKSMTSSGDNSPSGTLCGFWFSSFPSNCGSCITRFGGPCKGASIFTWTGGAVPGGGVPVNTADGAITCPASYTAAKLMEINGPLLIPDGSVSFYSALYSCIKQ